MPLQLRFQLHADAPQKWIDEWDAMTQAIRGGEETNQAFASKWVEKLKARGIGKAVDRCVLQRWEGGIGGGVNQHDRQLRFCEKHRMHGLFLPCNMIVVEAFDSDDGTSRWTMRGLSPFKAAFQQVLQDRLDELKKPLGVPIGDSCIDAIIVFTDSTPRRRAKKRQRAESDLHATAMSIAEKEDESDGSPDLNDIDEPSHPQYHNPFHLEATTSMGYPVMGDSERCKMCGQWQDYVCDDFFMCMSCGG